MALLDYTFEGLLGLILLYNVVLIWHKYVRVDKSDRLTGEILVNRYLHLVKKGL